MIEIFITSIHNKKNSERIKIEILKTDSDLKITFDLEDIDRVLRVEGIAVNKIVNKLGFQCYVML
ncbi:hypothetical protein [Flavobacterium sp. CLA17]|uniref:hypothetical protein n=1 Tax=Flavobacterium sp. CLA17 TaxID=2724135 RepID=UPI001492036E|nr:hypothetical protein [Flavobacterium sp. CLA17]QSB28777.1 hypothetical protein HAV12_008595 [Flavobacterium sp. CLA17]